MKEITELLNEIQEEKTRKTMLHIFEDVKKELFEKPAAVKYHHNDAGGFGRHVKEVMNFALVQFDNNPDIFKCTRDDVIVAAFVHDFNKVDCYEEAKERDKVRYGRKFSKKKGIWINESVKTVKLLFEYGYFPSEHILNAICLHHGSWSVDVSSPYGYVSSGDFTPLAILLHTADLLSSHIMGGGLKE